MIKLVFSGAGLDRLRREIWHPDLESAAILLGLPVRTDAGWRVIVREAHVVPEGEYNERTPVSVRISPGFGLPLEKKASKQGLSLIYCHTHPHQSCQASFSHIDDHSEAALAQYAEMRSPDAPHCALLFGEYSVAARRLGTKETVTVVQTNAPPNSVAEATSEDGKELYDRQIRAFGEAGQFALAKLRVAIVGLGGTGSIVAQQLAHLGVADFLLVDRDTIEESNLNRTVGASQLDVDATKVSVAERLIRVLRPGVSVTAIAGDIVDEGVAKKLTSVDFIFCCTDSHASRHLVNQLAYQYSIPAIDMGVAIDASGKVVRFAGHVKALVADQPCLWCMGNLDSKQIREEMMTVEQRQADPYVVGNVRVVQPAVISINSTVASAAVTMFLSMVAGLDAPARFLVYDGNRQRLAAVAATSDPACNFCGPDSSAGAGDRQPLPVRRDGTR